MGLVSDTSYSWMCTIRAIHHLVETSQAHLRFPYCYMDSPHERMRAMIPLYYLHPIAVHFPIALLSTGLLMQIVGSFYRKADWLPSAATWLLWVGTIGLWIAMALGLLAEDTAPSVPPALEVISDHKYLAFWAVGMFTFISLWKLILKNKLRAL